MAWSIVFGRPFVKLFALFCKTVVTPVCLSVMLVYYCQTVGWIKMPLGVEVDLGPGHIVLDGDQAPPTERRTAQQPPPFSPCLLWHNGRPSQQLLSSCLLSFKNTRFSRYISAWFLFRSLKSPSRRRSSPHVPHVLVWTGHPVLVQTVSHITNICSKHFSKLQLKLRLQGFSLSLR